MINRKKIVSYKKKITKFLEFSDPFIKNLEKIPNFDLDELKEKWDEIVDSLRMMLDNQLRFIKEQMEEAKTKYNLINELSKQLNDQKVSIEELDDITLNEKGIHKILKEIESFKDIIKEGFASESYRYRDIKVE